MKAEVAAPLIILAVAAAGWLGFTGLAVSRAALPAESSGMMLAAFPLAADDDEIYAAVIGAGGRAVRRTWFPGAWVVSSDDAGFAGRLKAAGAWGAFGKAPVGMPELGGCAVVSVDKAAVGKIRLGP